ncbi:ferredoxin--NADP reductase [SAR202 cluster bacterium AD-804-J14_MRT_500m]|nr:ferredoxin--NADP reductase [SAR202 cluster bacterium AD-804-J14_MRT_500m]
MATKQQVLPQATLVHRAQITDDLVVIKLKPDQPMAFKPGQYCTLGLDGIERAYSIVSGPHEAELEIFVELVPLPIGVLTPKIWNMKEGDRISIRPRCKGIFTLDKKIRSHLMVSTVTGIAPFMSMLRTYIHEGNTGDRFYLIQGASYADEFTYDKEINQMVLDGAVEIKYVTTVSRPTEQRNKEWMGEVGRANAVVKKYIEQFGLSSSACLIYTCGHPGMIEDIKQQLSPRGFSVKEERYWKN